MFKITMREETFAGWLQIIGLLFGAVGVILPATIIVMTPPRTMTVGALTVCALIFLFCIFAAILFFVLSHLADVIHRAARRGFREEPADARAPEKARRTEVKTEPLSLVESASLGRVPGQTQPPTAAAREPGIPRALESAAPPQVQKPAAVRKEPATSAAQPSSKIAPPQPPQKKIVAPVPVIHARVTTAVEEPTPTPPAVEEKPLSPLPVLEISPADDILSSDTPPVPAPVAPTVQAVPPTVAASGRSDAESMFESIKTFIDMEMWHLAYQRAKELIRQHPDSPEAARLKKNLDTFRKKAEEMLVAW